MGPTKYRTAHGPRDFIEHLIKAEVHFLGAWMLKFAGLLFTRKLCYRKDDRAMRPTSGCPENFRDSLTIRPRPFPIFSWAFVPVDPMNVPTKFEVRSFTRC